MYHNNNYEEYSLIASHFLNMIIFIYLFTDLSDDVIKALQTARRVTKEEMQTIDEEEEKKVVVNDMKNCFGFDVSHLPVISNKSISTFNTYGM